MFVLIGALRMPLHRHHKVVGRCALEGFDDAIGGTPGNQSQSLTHRIRGLMM